MLGTLTVLLSAQELPPLPPTPVLAEIPDPGALLPYRPFGFQAPSDGSVPLQYRGERVVNGPEGWTIERGALQSEDLLLLADHIQYNPVTGMLRAEGNIRLEGQGIRLRCERLAMDWNHRAGEAWALELEISPDWTLRSDHVAFASLKRWDFQKVEVSSCPQEKPGWSMTLSRLRLNLDKFATFNHAKLYVGPVPVLYLPWGTYPAKAKRSPGLLPTLPSYSSTLGLTLGLPYFQPLGDTMDLTFEPVFHSKENPLWGAEFRWNPAPAHSGTLLGHYIDQRTDGERRYRYQFKDLWQREDGWQFTADINQASDSLLESDYGQGVDNLGSTSFDSAIYLGKNFPLASLSFNVAEQRSFFTAQDDPFYQTGFPDTLRKQTLPEIQSRLYPIELGSFYLDAGVKGSRLAYRLEFDQEPNQVYTWDREDFFARLQGRLGQWGPFRADLQTLARFTHYGASLRAPLYDPAQAVSGTALSPDISPFLVDGKAIQRVLGSGRLQLSGPPLGRTFEHFSLFGYKGEVKHVIEPFFAVTRTSNPGVVARIPRFDDVDSRPGVAGSAMGEESLEFGLMQHYMGRRSQGDTFADLVRWKLSTKYFFQPILLSDGQFKKGWASIDSVFDAEPNDRLRISFRSSSDIASNTTDNSLSLELKSKEESQFRLAFFSAGISRFLVRQRGIQVGGLKRFLDDKLRLEFHMNYDYHKIVSSELALAFMTPCVATSVRYSHVALNTSSSLSREDRVDFVVSLRTLGDFKLFSR